MKNADRRTADSSNATLRLKQEAAGSCDSPMLARLRNLFLKGVLFDTEVLKDFLMEHVGNLTFQEAFDRTGRVLNITGEDRSGP